MRRHFEEQRILLHRELSEMVALCEEAVTVVAKALSSGEKESVGKVAPLNTEIDQKERDIETLCLKLLLHQHLAVDDLRQVSAALKIVTEMARIGDKAEDVAEVIASLSGRAVGGYIQVGEMTNVIIKMMVGSVEAYVKADAPMAERAAAQKDIVGSCFKQVKDSLTEVIVRSPKDSDYVLDFLMIVKYLERIGDHAANMAGWVLFSFSTDRHIELSRKI